MEIVDRSLEPRRPDRYSDVTREGLPMRAGAGTPPERGTRPRNRRALILAAAADLMAGHGYDQVSVGHIAGAAGIGPSALYRHFTGKQQLLREVITTGIIPVRELLDDLDLTDRTRALGRLGAVALDARHLGVLWQREARHLAPGDRASVRRDVRAILQRLARRVHIARPDLNDHAVELITPCLASVLTSPSFHHLDLPRPDYDRLLGELAGAVLDAPVDSDLPAPPAAEPPADLVPSSRREALLTQAVRMFAAHGYSGVGNEDIAAAVGIAGPSIYNHFGSKLDILVTAVQRGTAVLFTDLSTVYRTATSAVDALQRLIQFYLTFTRDNHDLVGLLITEAGHLPEEERTNARRAQHDYIGEWVHLLRAIHTDLDPVTARIRIHAVLSIANDAARTAHIRRNPSTLAALSMICAQLLQLQQ